MDIKHLKTKGVQKRKYFQPAKQLSTDSPVELNRFTQFTRKQLAANYPIQNQLQCAIPRRSPLHNKIRDY